MKQSNPLAVQYNKSNHALSGKEGGSKPPLCHTYAMSNQGYCISDISETLICYRNEWQTAALLKGRAEVTDC